MPVLNQNYVTSFLSSPMQRFMEGDRVRVDIPDADDPDHRRYHGTHGTIVKTIEDNADLLTGEERDGMIYRVKLNTGEKADFRFRDLRPPLD